MLGGGVKAVLIVKKNCRTDNMGHPLSPVLCSLTQHSFLKVRDLVKTLLEGLVPKEEAGKTLRCKDMIHYFKAFVKILNR